MPYARESELGLGVARLFSEAVDAAKRAGPAWLTLAAALALSLLGVYAISIAGGSGPSAATLSPLASKQLVYVAAGMLAAVSIALPHYRALGYASWVLFAGAVAMLVFLLIPFVPSSIVRPRNGARGWIDLGPVDLQPSEIAKIIWVITLAWYLRYRENHRTLRGLLPPAIITGIPVGLIMLEPDLGNACLFVPALFAVLVAAGAKIKHLALVVLLAACAAPLAYPLLMPHQKARIVGLVMQLNGDESADQDINMQSVTAQRLAGAGRLTGTTEEHSRTLIRFNALPESHNDMIFSVIVNRFGLAGGLCVLGLYLVWLTGALWTAALCREPFGRLMPVGLASFTAAQVFINVGMNLGLLPIIGVTLPLVSHGGTSMVCMWIMSGLVLSVALHRPKGSLRPAFEWEYD